MTPSSPCESPGQTAPPLQSRRGLVGLVLLFALTVSAAFTAVWAVSSWRNAGPDAAPASAEQDRRHAVTIRPRPRHPAIDSGRKGPDGKPILISCNTCHATKPPNADARAGADLREFHQGLKTHHGNLACVTCHNPSDGYMTFRLADGKSVPFDQPMTLCAQCHGTQYRDYLNGAHGGMTGHWDLSRGGRVRNSCVECHDPHAPRVRPVQPAPPPRDRFLPRGGAHE